MSVPPSCSKRIERFEMLADKDEETDPFLLVIVPIVLVTVSW